MRADRLLSLALLLQARGRMTGSALAGELGVTVRTVYRDLEALASAGLPVRCEAGPGGGCELVEGYRFPLRALRPEEAEALLVLGVPPAVRELGLGDVLSAAHRRVRAAAGLEEAARGGAALVHLDLPGWFQAREEVPHLPAVAEALRRRRRLAIGYRRRDGRSRPPRPVAPLGLVNKAGIWYLVAAGRDGRVGVNRVGRVSSARVLPEAFERPAGFDLAAFWARWSEEFVTSRPRIAVRLRATPQALAILPEIFGDGVRHALEAASPPDPEGWRVLTLSFEHELAAAHRLAGFGGGVEVLSPRAVRERLLAAARGILARYGGG